VELAVVTLYKYFQRAQKRFNSVGRPISITDLIQKYLKNTSGESRVFLLKLLELMDDNQNYLVEKPGEVPLSRNFNQQITQ